MSRTCRMSFELLATDGKARRGRLTFPRGVVETPAFMPVGTYGTVKGMLPRDIEATGAQMILGNTFHLWLRPGTEVIKGHGDLHDFMQWKNGKAKAWLPSITIRVGMIARVNGTLMTILEPWPLVE